MKRFGWVIVGIGLLVSGCGSESDVENSYTPEQEEMLETLAETLDALSYVDQYTEFALEVADYLKVVYEPIYWTKVNDKNKDKLIDSTNDLIFIIDTFNPSPQNEDDEVLDKHVQKVKLYAEDMTHWATKYINTPNVSDRSLFLESYENMLNEIKTIDSIMKKL